jgi:hypothetical protein
VGSFVPGPIDPSTYRGRSTVLNRSAAWRAMAADASASSKMRYGMSYSASALRFEPKLFVSTMSAPASR